MITYLILYSYSNRPFDLFNITLTPYTREIVIDEKDILSITKHKTRFNKHNTTYYCISFKTPHILYPKRIYVNIKNIRHKGLFKCDFLPNPSYVRIEEYLDLKN